MPQFGIRGTCDDATGCGGGEPERDRGRAGGGDPIEEAANNRSRARESGEEIAASDQDALAELLEVGRDGAEEIRFVGDPADGNSSGDRFPAAPFHAHRSPFFRQGDGGRRCGAASTHCNTGIADWAQLDRVYCVGRQPVPRTPADEGAHVSIPAEFFEMRDVAIAAAREAGAAIRAVAEQGVKEIVFKGEGKRDLVTEADKRSEQIIIDAITRRYPDHRILAEEGTGTGGAGAIPLDR